MRQKSSREVRKCANKNCSREFECLITETKKYCSHKCYSVCKKGIPSLNKLPREIRKCLNPLCDKEFECKIFETDKYCSYKCYWICKKGEPSYKKLPTELRKCLNAKCQKEFESRIDINQEYCSHQCYWEDEGRDRTNSKETIEKRIKSILKSVCKRPNKFETNSLNYLNTVYNNQFKYTGNGSFIVNRRSADAYSKELKTVALFHGVHWHLEIFNLEITEENKRVVEEKDSLPFLSAGYRVIFIWEDELNEAIEEKFVHKEKNKELCKIYN